MGAYIYGGPKNELNYVTLEAQLKGSKKTRTIDFDYQFQQIKQCEIMEGEIHPF